MDAYGDICGYCTPGSNAQCERTTECFGEYTNTGECRDNNGDGAMYCSMGMCDIVGDTAVGCINDSGCIDTGQCPRCYNHTCIAPGICNDCCCGDYACAATPTEQCDSCHPDKWICVGDMDRSVLPEQKTLEQMFDGCVCPNNKQVKR